MIPSIERYRAGVAKHLRCCKEAKERLLLSFDQSMLAPLLEDAPQPSTEDLHAAFGTPKQTAALLMEQVTEEEAARYHKQQKTRKAIIIGAITIILAAILVFSLHAFFWKETTIIEITDEGPVEGSSYIVE